jgi:hypothetical protein
MRAKGERVKRHREALAMRLEYLNQQIDRRRAEELPTSYALAERAAIRYVLAVLDDVEAIGLLHLAGRMAEDTRAELHDWIDQALEDDEVEHEVGAA